MAATQVTRKLHPRKRTTVTYKTADLPLAALEGSDVRRTPAFSVAGADSMIIACKAGINVTLRVLDADAGTELGQNSIIKAESAANNVYSSLDLKQYAVENVVLHFTGASSADPNNSFKLFVRVNNQLL